MFQELEKTEFLQYSKFLFRQNTYNIHKKFGSSN